MITEKGEFEFDREVGEWNMMNKEKLEAHLKKTVKYFEENEEIEITEVGDGNLNLVFIAKGKNKSIICK